MAPGITVLHDTGKPLCFVGRSSLTQQIMKLLQLTRECVNSDIEALEQQSDSWLAQHQFIALTSDVSFKMRCVETLDQRGVDWFSIIYDTSLTINPDVKIGRGTLVCNFVDMICGEHDIGDHVVLSALVQLGHRVIIEDFCHVSAFCFLNNSHIGQGSVIGLRSSIMNQTGCTTIPAYTNILSGSIINADITTSGTYYHRKRVDSRGSLEHRIL